MRPALLPIPTGWGLHIPSPFVFVWYVSSSTPKPELTVHNYSVNVNKEGSLELGVFYLDPDFSVVYPMALNSVLEYTDIIW